MQWCARSNEFGAFNGEEMWLVGPSLTSWQHSSQDVTPDGPSSCVLVC
jgi:hypothetical protein